MRLKIRAVERDPFFYVDGDLFVDVTFNYGHQLLVEQHDLNHLIKDGGREVVIGRRLSRDEAQQVKDALRSGAHEAFAYLIPSDAKRWRKPRSGRHR